MAENSIQDGELEAIQATISAVNKLSDVLKELSSGLLLMLEGPPTDPACISLDSIAFAMGALQIAAAIHPDHEDAYRDAYHLLQYLTKQTQNGYQTEFD